jgi:type I restriction enzyme S subunit
LKKYDRYKPSGLEWIDEIPNHWEMSKVKYTFNFFDNERIPLSANDRGLMKNKDYDYYGASGIIDKVTDYIFDGDYILIGEDGANLLDRNSDLVFKASGKFWVNNHAHILQPKNTNLNYFIYYLESLDYTIWVSGSAQPKLTAEALKNINIFYPGKKEQQNIVNYLDRKISKINEIIAEKENLIKLLEEEKEITISNIVTKGLNPNVEMQESRVEWIGKIPKNWDSIAIKHLVSIPVTDGPHETPEFLNMGIPFISAEAIKNNIIDFSKIRGHISKEDHLKYSKKYKPQRNDIYMIKSGATTGNLAMVETDKEFNIWSPLAVIRVNKSKLLPKFTFYFLLSYNFFEAVKFNWSYGTQQNIGMNVIENISICVPLDLNEQQNIVDFLDKKTDEINQTIQTVKDEIKLLKEYKETLIYEVVTGKIDVREEVVS